MKEKIRNFIEKPEDADLSFSDLSIQLFDYLYRKNEVYQQFCRKKGIGIRQVQSWKDIPSVPTEAFKRTFLSSTLKKECNTVFMTSGTSSGKKGKHYHKDLDIYDLSAKTSFQKYVTDDIRPMAILFPDEKEMKNSSLSHYLTMLKQQVGTDDSAFFVTDKGLQKEQFIHWIAEHKDEPVMILGASYSFVHLLDELQETYQLGPLHEKSMIFDTGGYKNNSRELKEKDFYKQLAYLFQIKEKNFVNMYGMTELSSQYYASMHNWTGKIKKNPHWIRFKIIDPISGEEVPKGQIGLLVHVDLANINSVPAVQTNDLAIDHGKGFELLGRQLNADPKGCSITAQQWLEEKR